jgi:hypothetical protein
MEIDSCNPCSNPVVPIVFIALKALLASNRSNFSAPYEGLLLFVIVLAHIGF